MDALTLDQIQVMLAVADHGSFSAAARALGRAQSAITYAVQRLEEQVGAPLFDRSAYRATMTESGRALLPRARRVAAEIGALRAQARAMGQGVEAEIAVVVDAMFPMCSLLPALGALAARFPTVTPRIRVASLGAVAGLVLDGSCALGLASEGFSAHDALWRRQLFAIGLVGVCAPTHPLAGAVPGEPGDHIQLVLTDPSGLSGAGDHGVLSARTWRIADLGAKHAMLLAGLGWGTLPEHLARDDIARGRLVALPEAVWPGAAGETRLGMCCIGMRSAAMGPATRWLAEHAFAPDTA